ncbi:MAG: energy transducer TonB [Spirochaetaceae bacterium]|jgi:protein TonB|nr:energy transducer TonB [Spirochaetaceae bacterium]
MKANYSHRAFVFAVVAGIHLAAIFGIAVTVDTVLEAPPERADVIKLVDVNEAPPPPPDTSVQQNITEAVAENLVETEVVPDLVAAAPTAISALPADEYVSQSKISKMPRFDEKEILAKLVYPSIAQRSGIDQGRVILELFVNKQGVVTRINILREEPEGRGFGEAAVKAFSGAQAVPAEANGQITAVRIRYPVRFQLR